MPNSPYATSADAPFPTVLDIAKLTPGGPPDDTGYFVQERPLPFPSDYLRSTGGTTMHWLGTCLRMLPNDFELAGRYGVGHDWAIGYDDLLPYYERAERSLGWPPTSPTRSTWACASRRATSTRCTASRRATPIVVHDRGSALDALKLIVDEGEGFRGTVFDGDHEILGEEEELAHYFRFDQLARGRRYVRGDTPSSGPTGPPVMVDYAAVAPMRLNPARGLPARQRAARDDRGVRRHLRACCPRCRPRSPATRTRSGMRCARCGRSSTRRSR